MIGLALPIASSKEQILSLMRVQCSMFILVEPFIIYFIMSSDRIQGIVEDGEKQGGVDAGVYYGWGKNEIIKIIQLMFSFDGVKIEEDPFNSLLNPDCFNHCITSFYDHDSEQAEIAQAKCSSQEILYYLHHTVDLIDTPLNDIMRLVEENPLFKGVELQVIRKRVIREKTKLKRERAKNRSLDIPERKAPAYLPMIDELDEEYKKQRNRISAQISRDRKKEKVKALEELNRQLQEECRQQREVNERLIREAKQRSKQEPLKSPFARMLIFLGIFFLFAMIKDIFGATESTKTIAKIQESTIGLISPKETLVQSYIPPSVALEEIEKTLTQTVPDQGAMSRLRQGLRRKVTGWIADRRLSNLFQSLVSVPPQKHIQIDS